MRLFLHYRGPLRSNGDALHKQQIRMHFSAQLAQVWRQPPLSDHPEFITDAGDKSYDFRREVGGRRFIPLVTAQARTVAELKVTLLRPGLQGELLKHGGDLDNRMKTLFDALTVPQANQLRDDFQPDGPVFCLLEDDGLVTQMTVQAEQLLEPVERTIVDLTVEVQTRITAMTWGNMAFA